MKASMWALSYEAPRSALPARIENQISTWLSQDARVGVKWKCTFGWRFSQRSFFGLCVLRLSSMDLASSVLSDNPVHEVEKFKPSPPLVLTPRHLARRNVESGEERRRAMPGVVVRLARQRPAARHRQIALRALPP